MRSKIDIRYCTHNHYAVQATQHRRARKIARNKGNKLQSMYAPKQHDISCQPIDPFFTSISFLFCLFHKIHQYAGLGKTLFTLQGP